MKTFDCAKLLDHFFLNKSIISAFCRALSRDCGATDFSAAPLGASSSHLHVAARAHSFAAKRRSGRCSAEARSSIRAISVVCSRGASSLATRAEPAARRRPPRRCPPRCIFLKLLSHTHTRFFLKFIVVNVFVSVRVLARP